MQAELQAGSRQESLVHGSACFFPAACRRTVASYGMEPGIVDKWVPCTCFLFFTSALLHEARVLVASRHVPPCALRTAARSRHSSRASAPRMHITHLQVRC